MRICYLATSPVRQAVGNPQNCSLIIYFTDFAAARGFWANRELWQQPELPCGLFVQFHEISLLAQVWKIKQLENGVALSLEVKNHRFYMSWHSVWTQRSQMLKHIDVMSDCLYYFSAQSMQTNNVEVAKDLCTQNFYYKRGKNGKQELAIKFIHICKLPSW